MAIQPEVPKTIKICNHSALEVSSGLSVPVVSLVLVVVEQMMGRRDLVTAMMTIRKVTTWKLSMILTPVQQQ